MKKTAACALSLITLLLLPGCDARKFVRVSVERMEVCSLTVVKGGNVTLEDEPLVKDFKFSVVFNRSLKDKLVEIHVKCEGGFHSAQTFKLGEIAGKRVVFEQNGGVRVVSSETSE